VIVADTHALLWWLREQHQLSAKARHALDTESIGVASITCFEIARLAERKRILLEQDP
jgi:PIN domain nuclease of toxin-antitoxin system